MYSFSQMIAAMKQEERNTADQLAGMFDPARSGGVADAVRRRIMQEDVSDDPDTCTPAHDASQGQGLTPEPPDPLAAGIYAVGPGKYEDDRTRARVLNGTQEPWNTDNNKD